MNEKNTQLKYIIKKSEQPVTGFAVLKNGNIFWTYQGNISLAESTNTP